MQLQALNLPFKRTLTSLSLLPNPLCSTPSFPKLITTLLKSLPCLSSFSGKEFSHTLGEQEGRGERGGTSEEGRAKRVPQDCDYDPRGTSKIFYLPRPPLPLPTAFDAVSLLTALSSASNDISADDSSTCSCIFGNPCVTKDTCKTWIWHRKDEITRRAKEEKDFNPEMWLKGPQD